MLMLTLVAPLRQGAGLMVIHTMEHWFICSIGSGLAPKCGHVWGPGGGKGRDEIPSQVCEPDMLT